jgi:cation-transporting ATPase E
VVLVSYVLARNAVGAPPASECLVQTEGSKAVANVICWQPSSAATISLLFTAFWILVVLSRPFKMWKALLVGSMVALAALAFITPLGQSFFNFSLTPTLLWESLAVGAVGALAIEIIYRTEPAMRAAAAD